MKEVILEDGTKETLSNADLVELRNLHDEADGEEE